MTSITCLESPWRLRETEYRSSIASLLPLLQYTEYPSPSNSAASLHAAAAADDGVGGGAQELSDAAGISSLAGLFLLNTVPGDTDPGAEAESPVGGFGIRNRNGDEGDEAVGDDEEAEGDAAAEEDDTCDDGLR